MCWREKEVAAQAAVNFAHLTRVQLRRRERGGGRSTTSTPGDDVGERSDHYGKLLLGREAARRTLDHRRLVGRRSSGVFRSLVDERCRLGSTGK